MTTSDATQQQILASKPDTSTWLSANAGSGKTKVLTDRVARLLLNGTLPERILCLTYTKAAANEMQNRLFSRLGSWSMMPDTELRENLLLLGLPNSNISTKYLSNSRRLFAQAVETPGGLKIQTIHSFCSSMLRRFSLEAGVSPSFTEMDGRVGKKLRFEVLESIAELDADVFGKFITHFSGSEIDSILLEIIKHKEALSKYIGSEEIMRILHIPPNIKNKTDTVKLTFPEKSETLLELSSFITAAIRILAKQSQAMQDLAVKLSGLNLTNPGIEDLNILFDCFLYKNGLNFLPQAKYKSIPTKKAQEALGENLSKLSDLMEQVAMTLDMQLKLQSFEKTNTLHLFSVKFLETLERKKEIRGLLDFDDLIHKTINLLKNPTFANYILYRLDGGIDHILVDEAQDNSPKQWEIIRLLTQDFVSGESARTKLNRTIFAVGDKKQSIYSFQGADPNSFDSMQEYFSNALRAISKNIQPLNLLHSFRSSKPILNLVDASFKDSFFERINDQPSHLPFKENLPGKVDLWDWISDEKDEYDTLWYDPVDTIGKKHHTIKLANKIAEKIYNLIDYEQITQVDSNKTSSEINTRRIEPADFLILVQTRSTLFHEIIRSCKQINLPIAGTDRLDLMKELGVKDLISLLSYLVTPEDNLSLAEVLRSPLCNLSEDTLFKLAYNRKKLHLYEVLNNRKEEFYAVWEMLNDLRNKVDYMRPYEILEYILTFHNGRRKFVSRLGSEVEEVLDVLLEQAIEYERTEVPSVTGFLLWICQENTTVKRSLHASENKIRIMTVHGAKGLEAPIVILPDTGPKKNTLRDEIITLKGCPIWKANSEKRSLNEQNFIDKVQEQHGLEEMRLLYVSITRAESWLIICGSGSLPNPTNPCWYQLLEQGMTKLNAQTNKVDTGKRLTHLEWPTKLHKKNSSSKTMPTKLPNWLATNAPQASDRITNISPSKIGLKKSIDGPETEKSNDQTLSEGSGLHLLLEHLPSVSFDSYQEKARDLLSGFELSTVSRLTNKVVRILNNKDFNYIFLNKSFSEVNISAKFEFLKNQKVIGVIDRLVFMPNYILAVDFKSNTRVPKNISDVPSGILQQMGAYQEILKKIYPDTSIQTAILWTEKEYLMKLDELLVKEAFINATIS
ncbi:MAG: double-strand break repair helicase AddA [Rhodobacterales bacterium]